MFTKEFIKISQILDYHGMHRQADDLLKIAQQKKPAAPAKPASPVQIIPRSKQNDRIENYKKAIEKITNNDNINTSRAKFLKTDLDKQYNDNLLSYNTYKNLFDTLISKVIQLNITLDNNQLLGPKDPTAFPSNVNEDSVRGRNLTGYPNPITKEIILADPVEGVTAAGEKAFQNREDRNLPKLRKEWNEYLKTDSFKTSIQSRINWLEKNEPGTDTTQLQQLLDKANNKETGLQVGDFGNKEGASEVYGVEAKPLTSITGTPTTPAPGTVTPVAPTRPTAPNRQ